ncbi:MAG: ABC transporter ATP-binding protein [Chloroflexota bacterium]
MSRLSIRAVAKTFPGVNGGAATQALLPVSLDVADNDFITILGLSGCGKSTLLRLVAGLEEPSTGEILLDGTPIHGPGADRGVVFQSYTLFPWLTVRQNICFGLRQKGMPPAEQAEISSHYIDRMGLKGFADHYPKQLSGGMQQRVAIARALTFAPPFLLMDEPFGALDLITRDRMAQELLRIWSSTPGTTVLFITHSISEAILLSDRVVVLSPRPGHVQRIVDVDLPRPRTEAVRESQAFFRYDTELRRLLLEAEGPAETGADEAAT